MRDLAQLIERVEKLTGPDREVDALIAALLEPHRFDAPGFTSKRPIPAFRYDPSEGAIRFDGGGIMDVRFFPPVTASLDAAIALTERVLPGWAIISTMRGGNGTFMVHEPDKVPFSEAARGDSGMAPRPAALALLLATLKALASPIVGEP